MSNPVLEAIKTVYDKVMSLFSGTEVEEVVEDTEVFMVEAAQWAGKNIKPELLKIVAACTLAAEQAFTGPNQGDNKWDFAFKNVIAAAEKEAVAFIVADVNYAIEAVVQHRNAEAAKLAAPLAAPPSDASGEAKAAS